MTQMYSWPIPDPNTLSKYWDINSNFPDRIIKLAEKEQNFRQKTSIDLINKEFKFQQTWMYFGFIILVLVIFLSWYLAFLWEDTKAIWLVIGVILFYWWVYIYWVKAEPKNTLNNWENEI